MQGFTFSVSTSLGLHFHFSLFVKDINYASGSSQPLIWAYMILLDAAPSELVEYFKKPQLKASN